MTTPSHDDPVFLVGCPRSGTTLLQRILNAHSAVAIAPETHFIRRFWLPRATDGHLADTDAMQRLIDDVIAMPEFTEMGLDTAAFRASTTSGERAHRAIFGQLLTMFADRRGACVVGEKTPNHLIYMRTLESWFPGARFIHIVRDPRAVVCSWRDVPWSTGRPVGDAMVWRRYLATARRRPPLRQGALTTIRYEELILDTEATVRTVCRFLGLEFEPQMLSFHLKPSDIVNVAREPWKAAADRPIQDTSVDRWRSELSPDTVARIEAAVWPEMKRWPYPPSTPALRRLLAAAIVRPSERVRKTCRRAARWWRS